MNEKNPTRPANIVDHYLTQESFSVSWDASNLVGQTTGVDLSRLDNYYGGNKYASHQKNKAGFFGFFYRLAQSQALSYKCRLLTPMLPKQAAVLDYGCGIGDFLAHMQDKGYQVQGYEPSKSAEAIVKERGVSVVSWDTLSNRKSVYNMITLWHVLEHIPDIDGAISLFHQSLWQQGLLVLALPNPNAKDAQVYGADWAAWDVPRHLWHFTPQGIKNKLEHFGFELKGTHPLPLDAFYVSLLSEGYKKSSFRWLRAFWNGMKSNLSARKTGNYSSLIYIFQKC